MFAALIGTLFGIWAMIKKERKSLALIGLILNGIPLALFILIMIMMFLSFVVGI
jgi:ABC-type dipeptide/oligopeptide/nickel transport system permease component